jgi:hypothetical protein
LKTETLIVTSRVTSTGQKTKSAAREQCRKLERAGELIPTRDPGTPKLLTFGELALNFSSRLRILGDQLPTERVDNSYLSGDEHKDLKSDLHGSRERQE